MQSTPKIPLTVRKYTQTGYFLHPVGTFSGKIISIEEPREVRSRIGMLFVQIVVETEYGIVREAFAGYVPIVTAMYCNRDKFIDMPVKIRVRHKSTLDRLFANATIFWKEPETNAAKDPER